jgi:predicted peroxiredoxin
MAKYLLIESRDPFESNDVAYYYELATGLAKEGNDVTLFLVQNGVFPARKSSKSDGLVKAAAAGVHVLADEFSLRERGIKADRLLKEVTASPLDVVVDALAEGKRTLWH